MTVRERIADRIAQGSFALADDLDQITSDIFAIMRDALLYNIEIAQGVADKTGRSTVDVLDVLHFTLDAITKED